MINDLILEYEKSFFSMAFCINRQNLESILAEDFFEYGQSGQVWDRTTTIDTLTTLTEDRQIEISDFNLTELSENVLMTRWVSYHELNKTYALRTSIWKKNNNQWQLFFHQGTPMFRNENTPQ